MPDAPWWLYLIECLDGSYYLGMTQNVAARAHQHWKGVGGHYTRARGVAALVGAVIVEGDRRCAAQAERRLKRLSTRRRVAYFRANGDVREVTIEGWTLVPANADREARWQPPTDLPPSSPHYQLSKWRRLMHHSNQLRRWHQMNDRERMVWSCTFAQPAASALEAAAQAELAVSRLKALDIDESLRAPEYDTARANVDLTLEDFTPWYRVALLISRRPISDAPPTAEEYAAAYERYRRSQADFY